MNSRIITYLLAIIILFPTLAIADFKIATVDVNRIINESKESKAAKKDLDQQFAEAKKKIDAKRDALKSIEQKIKDGSIKEDSKEGEKYKSDAREFTRLVKDTEDDLRKKFLKSNKALTEKAIKLIRAYAEKNNLDLVFDKSERMRGPVLFANPSSDITDEVVKSMNS